MRWVPFVLAVGCCVILATLKLAGVWRIGWLAVLAPWWVPVVLIVLAGVMLSFFPRGEREVKGGKVKGGKVGKWEGGNGSEN